MSDPIVTYLQQHLDEYVADLRHLSSHRLRHRRQGRGRRRPGLVEERMQRLGFSVERRPQERWGDDLVARGQGEGSARILLLGHADTVYPRGTAALRPVTAVGDKLIGPGTCDMKAGLLTGLYALRALDHVGWRDYGDDHVRRRLRRGDRASAIRSSCCRRRDPAMTP